MLKRPQYWVPTRDKTEYDRRTLYMIYKRNLRLPFEEVFDAPDTLLSCARREQSTHAPQALELLNGQTSNELAAAFAERLLKERAHARERIDYAWRLAAGRLADGRREGAGAEVPGRRARRSRQGEGIRPGRFQPQRFSLRELIWPNTFATPAIAASF